MRLLPADSKGLKEGEAATSTARMAGMAGGIVEEADSVLDELVKLRNWKEEMATT